MNKKTAIQRIFLIRHGQSLQNIGLTTGQDIFDGDVPLSPLGEKQAYEAGAFLKAYHDNSPDCPFTLAELEQRLTCFRRHGKVFDVVNGGPEK